MPNEPRSGDRPHRSWSGLPPAERRAGRRAALIQAGFELLGGEGLAATTVRGVCRRAGLNARYFYESFDSVDDLVVAVYDHVADELVTATTAAADASADSAEAQIRAAVDRAFRFVDEDPRRARVLYAEALGIEALNRRRIETGHRLVAVAERRAGGSHGLPPDEPIGGIRAAIVVGGLTELLSAWSEGRIPRRLDDVVADTSALFLGLRVTAARVASDRAGVSAGRTGAG